MPPGLSISDRYHVSVICCSAPRSRPYGAAIHSVDIDGVLPGVRRTARRAPIARNGVSDAEDMEQDATVGVLQAARSVAKRLPRSGSKLSPG
jgi:hypothetical protein